MLTRCPYTLKPLTELAETSREHVILDALGGPDAYSVRACPRANSKLGETVDAAFLAESLVEAARSRVGVKSRSGVTVWNLTGETVEGNRPVDVTIPHQGPVDVYHRKPIEKDAETNSYRIIAQPEQADKLLEELKDNLAKKGKEIAKVEITQRPSQQIHSRIQVDFTVLQTGLMKIAYLACCEFLGDSFLDDALNPEWQKAIRAQSWEDAEKIKIHGCCFDKAADCVNRILPKMPNHQHGIAIVNLKQSGPVVAVRLFGDELLTAVVCASETSNHGRLAGQGQLLICDSKTGMIHRKQIIAKGAS